MDPLHLEVRPYIQSWAHWEKKKKNPLGFIFPASAILLWCCSEICFHQADSIRELGNEKSAIELDEEGRGEDGEKGSRGGGGALGGGKEEEIARRKEVTLIQNEHIYLQFFFSVPPGFHY